MRNADLKDITVPGVACLQQRPLHLHNGGVRIRDRRGLPDRPITTGIRYLNLVEYPCHAWFGDVEEPGVSDAAVPLECDNNAGTADGELLYSLAVFSGRTGRPQLLGSITPRVQHGHEPATLIGGTRRGVGWQRNELVIKEFFYGPHDGTCCPSGRAESAWILSGGRLRPGHTTITRHAR